MAKAKPISKEKLEEQQKASSRDALIALLMNGSSKQAVCIVASLANKCKTFEEFQSILNSFAAKCKEEIKNEKV